MNSTQFIKIIDAVDEGVLIIDENSIIKMFNEKARLLTGVDIKPVVPHESGTLRSGDLVVIVDNRLGYDDGGLDVAHLERIGINTDGLACDDAFVAVGIYDDPKSKGELKVWKNKTHSDHLIFETMVKKHKISTSINLKEKEVLIKIDETSYLMNYAIAIGHMVIFDLHLDRLKFYQDRGYSVRNETVSELLRGMPFRAKGIISDVTKHDMHQGPVSSDVKAQDCSVIDKPMAHVLKSELLFKMVEQCQLDEVDKIDYTYVEINQRPTLCGAEKLEDSKLIMVKMIDLSDANELIRQRNQLIATLEKTTQQLFVSKIHKNSVGATGIIGNSNAIQRINFLIEKAAKTKSTVLITGESGTGKTLIAEKIHKSGQKSEKTPFVSVNCTAIPHQLFESELFGYVKGAFTGAEKSGKIGLFEMADGGTLFLDEIGELPQNMQVKLLQVLQSKSFYKVGATKPTKVDVRIIAATNKDLHSEIENRNFREDLYYRISAFPIHVAPLRERKADLYSLIDSISMKITESMEMTSKDISGEAMAMLLGYHWPGNVRELENVLELAYNLSESKMIEAEDIILSSPVRINTQHQTLKSTIEEAERKQITKILDETDYDIKKTIETLEISRSVFYEKAKKYEIGLKK